MQKINFFEKLAKSFTILKCEKVLEKENRIDKENIQSYNA